MSSMYPGYVANLGYVERNIQHVSIKCREYSSNGHGTSPSSKYQSNLMYNKSALHKS